VNRGPARRISGGAAYRDTSADSTVLDKIGVQQIEYGVPRGLGALRDGALDVLFGNAVHAPDDIRPSWSGSKPSR
jgi:hypothetical protein